jgi:hypothetical protein
MYGEGENARGLFSTAGHGRNFRRGRPRAGTIDRFAQLLSEHDLETGDRGGDVRACSQRLGVKVQAGHAMLQRIRRGLGPQAI